MNILSHRFLSAFEYAFELHQNQLRKGTLTPYIAHLIGVASLVIESGGDEDQAIAALLHDAVEDQGGLDTLREIKDRFGARVAKIVEGCTDSFTIPKPPWRERKEAYLAHLDQVDEDTRLVSLADKLYNVRSILVDLQWNGQSVWDRFTGGREGSIWYYTQLADAFDRTINNPMAGEFRRQVDDLIRLG
jgi:GTP pyrophosphokinase